MENWKVKVIRNGKLERELVVPHQGGGMVDGEACRRMIGAAMSWLGREGVEVEVTRGKGLGRVLYRVGIDGWSDPL